METASPETCDVIARLRQMTSFLTPKTFADLFGIKVGTIAAWEQRGIGPKRIKINNLVRFNPADVIEWLEEQQAKRSKRTAPAPATPAPAPLPAWLQPANKDAKGAHCE